MINVLYIHNSHFPLCSKNEHYHIHAIKITLWSKQLHALDHHIIPGCCWAGGSLFMPNRLRWQHFVYCTVCGRGGGGGGVQGNDSLSRENWSYVQGFNLPRLGGMI